MEDKKDKKIRLLSDEVDRLRKENAELQGKVNEMSKQKKFYAKEKGKYQKATNKAIKEFNKSLS